ncbi:MAG: metalloregulator ArsR/SmtB family transcription factor [Patescibacteria group bacterium]|nr:metalloregulator ArsR/SmtB family transcription factor [Patescibacteria group bacterium]
MKDTEKLLKALANRRRLAIVKYLNKNSKASVGEVAREIKLSFKATSKHLGLLRTADILDREQVNLQMFYSLNRPVSSLVKSVLDVL